MTKYTRQAVFQLAMAIATSAVVGFGLAFLTVTFGLEAVITGLGVAVFLFCSYKYIKIQSEINERLDRLKNK